MDVCPFCHSEVSEDLVRFGGTCPSCLADIPGEEAPTDPGAKARAAHEAADRAAVQKDRWIVPSVLAGALIGVLGFAMWTVLRPEPVATVLDFDDVAYEMDATQFVAWVEPEPEPQPTAPTPRARPRTVHDLKVSLGEDPPDLGDTTEVASSGVPDEAGTREVQASTDAVADLAEDASGPGTQAGGIQFGIDVGVSRRATKGVRLTDDSAIIEMIKRVLTAELPRLKSCYETRLKVDEDLAGRWTLAFVVGREGDVRNVSVVGSDTGDPDLEACIATKVSKWEFQPIRADQPVQKTLTFRPGF